MNTTCAAAGLSATASRVASVMALREVVDAVTCINASCIDAVGAQLRP
ncbi:Uncharacterised protein [Mycobacteroides abscessus subsp. abscessus]|nr:Uncharacterised protein [Mycobacteroides abscessus subsp. abscessus]